MCFQLVGELMPGHYCLHLGIDMVAFGRGLSENEQKLRIADGYM